MRFHVENFKCVYSLKNERKSLPAITSTPCHSLLIMQIPDPLFGVRKELLKSSPGGKRKQGEESHFIVPRRSYI